MPRFQNGVALPDLIHLAALALVVGMSGTWFESTTGTVFEREICGQRTCPHVFLRLKNRAVDILNLAINLNMYFSSLLTNIEDRD